MTADEIKEYCKARLQEVECINHLSHTPSAIMAIAAFVGYLSRLAFWGRHQIPGVTFGSHNLIDQDEDAFNAFIVTFLKQYSSYCDVEQLSNGQTRTHYWLYTVLRCGLVHSMSFYDKWKPNAQNQLVSSLPKPHVLITHDSTYSSPSRPLPYPHWGTNSIVINAFDLCAALRVGIEDMFNDQDARTNAETFVKWQPPIQGLGLVQLTQSNGANSTASPSLVVAAQSNSLSS